MKKIRSIDLTTDVDHFPPYTIENVYGGKLVDRTFDDLTIANMIALAIIAEDATMHDWEVRVIAGETGAIIIHCSSWNFLYP